MKGLRARIDYLLKHVRALNWLYVKGLGAALRLIGLFLRTDERLVLLSGHGRKFNDSPRVLFEAMKLDPRCAHLHYVWALEKGAEASIDGAEIVFADSPRYFQAALKARYWITCVNIERGLTFKKRGTFSLNTWHGTPLKTIGNAAGGRRDYDFSNIDAFCCAGDYEREIYLRDFGVRPGAILMSGLPRNDALYHAGEAECAAARQRLTLPDGARVLLYAPTWRDSLDGGNSYVLKPPIDMARWRARLTPNTIVLVRAHAYTNRLLGIAYDDFVRDATDYPDVNDLLLAADVLITDYSAILFDYSILERPILCFGYDYDAYAQARGLYLDLRKALPGGVIETEDALLDRLATLDIPAECARTRSLKRQFLSAGGDATRMCIERMMEARA